MLDLEERSQSKTEPSREWRNWYRVTTPGVRLYVPIAALWRDGLYPGPSIFPSKDVAEFYATKFLSIQDERFLELCQHAGAYPEGEGPV